jgi:DNA-binding CsgD family transcriptional regulator
LARTIPQKGILSRIGSLRTGSANGPSRSYNREFPVRNYQIDEVFDLHSIFQILLMIVKFALVEPSSFLLRRPVRSNNFRNVSVGFHRDFEAVILSLRERQVVGLLMSGKTNKGIAIAINISEKTVKHYMIALMQKLPGSQPR